MPITGNINGMKELADKIRVLTSAGFKTELAQVLGAAAVFQVAYEFRSSKDPYGNRWEPLRYRKGKPLLKTGRMSTAVTTSPTANGFRLRIATVYAPVHQYGGHVAPHSRIKPQVMWHNPKTGRLVARTTKLTLVHESTSKHRTYGKGITIPRRQMLPEADTGKLGPIWTKAFNVEAASLIRRRLQRAA